jgi:outer membrane protein TolC
LVKDVSDVYWDLHFAHRQLEIETRSRDDAMLVWQKALAKRGQGLGGGIADEAQSHESFLAARARLEEAQAQVALTETRFRRLLGLPGSEHQRIVPFEQPTREMPATAWMDMLINAFSQRFELRATKLSIRNLEAQLEAAQNYAQPRFDFVGNFHLNGFGDKAFSGTSTSTEVPRGSYENLLRGDETGWTLGFVFSRPTDPRLPLTLKHQLELRLAKTRAALAAQEWEITRELSYAVKNAERWYLQTGTHEERVAAARTQVSALEAAFPTGRVSVDQLVRAQSTLAQAETEFARSLAEYNKTLAELEFRQGILLDRHAISVLDDAESENGEFEE